MSQSSSPAPTEGRLLALLTAALYALFTLLPNSSSLVVSWPFVFIWQVALLAPLLWWLWQVGQRRRLEGLGFGLDRLALLALAVLVLNSLGSPFPQQARWYSWAALGYLGALYGLTGWLTQGELDTQKERHRGLLTFQGGLNLLFILISLSFWSWQTLLPQLNLLAQFRELGVNQRFSFNTLELRNWVPLGHQNYVAGYLVLALPLLAFLALTRSGRQRWLWSAAFLLGLLDFYTTSSRGGLLALGSLALFGLLYGAVAGLLSRRWLLLGAGGFVVAVSALVVSNDRLKSTLLNLAQGQGLNEISYRLLNLDIGWRMGRDHLLTGAGLGNVPLLYQKYRPVWAGRESEFTYQLHNTPAQVWAELGLGGILLGLGLTVWLVVGSATLTDQGLAGRADLWSAGVCVSALLAYGVMALTDFQLDNLAISGTLVLYLAVFVSYRRRCKNIQSSEEQSFRGLSGVEARTSPVPRLKYFTLQVPHSEKLARPVFFGGLGLILAALVWLFPFHRAWQLSNLGFQALAAEKYPAFEQYLTQAQKWAPWVAYYPWQLGWNLGNQVFINPDLDPGARGEFQQKAIAEFQRGIEVSPYMEFAHNNLGWLQLNGAPQAASQSFSQGLKLVPAKRGLFFALGLSYLGQQKAEPALQAFSLECLRDPLFITSPLWRSPGLAPLYPRLLTTLHQTLKQLRQTQAQNENLTRLLGQIQGGFYWWQGDLAQAKPLILQYGAPTAQALLALAENPDLNLAEQFPDLPAPAKQVFQAWQDPPQRDTLLTQAWISQTQTLLPPSLLERLTTSMAQSPDFLQWLAVQSPVLQYRRQRLGFGVGMRQIDGPNPDDFYVVVENLPMVTWFAALLPSPVLDPALDLALQPLREQLQSGF